MMILKRVFRSLVFAVALAIATGAITTAPASAMPKNPCADLLHQARVNSSLARWWTNYGQVLLSLGWHEQAIDAFDTAHVFADWAQVYLGDAADLGC